MDQPSKVNSQDKPGTSDRTDALWRILSRYDTYIGTTNAKAAILVAYNTFVVAATVLKFDDVLRVFRGHPHASWFGGLLLILVALAATTSLAFTILTIGPSLWSSRRPRSQHSIIFFREVSEFTDEKEYIKAVRAVSTSHLSDDVAAQVYSVARITSSKFRKLQIATWAAMIQLVFLGLILITKLVVLIPQVTAHHTGG